MGNYIFYPRPYTFCCLLDNTESWIIPVSISALVVLLGIALIKYYRRLKGNPSKPEITKEKEFIQKSQNIESTFEGTERCINQEPVSLKSNNIESTNLAFESKTESIYPDWLENRTEMIFPAKWIKVCQLLGKGNYGEVCKAKLTQGKAVLVKYPIKVFIHLPYIIEK